MKPLVFCVSIAALGIILPSPTSADSPPDQRLNELHSAWQRRAALFENVEISWETETFCQADWINARQLRHGGKPIGNEPTKESDAEFYTFRQEHRVSIAGDRLLWKTSGQSLTALSAGALRQTDETRAFDGKTSVSLGFKQQSDGVTFPQAVMRSDKRSFLVTDALYPLLVNFRPFDGDLEPYMDLKSFKLTHETCTINGFECVCLRLGRHAIWVAPGARSAVMRLSYFQPDLTTILRETTITFDPLAKDFAPKGWKSVHQNKDGQIITSTEAVVTNMTTDRRPGPAHQNRPEIEHFQAQDALFLWKMRCVRANTLKNRPKTAPF